MSEDRRARLAALRKNRSNKDANKQESSPTETTEPVLTTEDQPQDELLSKETGEDKEHDQQVSQTQAEGRQALSGEQEELHSNSDIELEDDDKPEKHKVSYTKDMRDDLKLYYHKAEIRTNRAINRIIQGRLAQE
ncbi:hypothetical protein Cantr_04039 [Candida viswanathii]|uniref:Uncharacterized protein n=1 Tax=Candida viswanathii TaxID=5486 RepID=A0A367XNH0_9ASCO|nr:hypothetical protein Cantr_04039 [Candida viswanathii]